MKFVDVGGERISAIGLGCWQFGSKDWGYGNRYAQETAVQLVHTALDLGVNLVDTAEVYARGVSEAIVGRALEGGASRRSSRRRCCRSCRRRRTSTSTAGCRRCGSASTCSTCTRSTGRTPRCRCRRRWRACAGCRTTASSATSA